MIIHCPSCEWGYTGAAWQTLSRLNGTQCVECYTNLDCPALCSTEHDGAPDGQLSTSRFTCPETLRVFFPCWMCDVWLPTGNDALYDGIAFLLGTGYRVCASHEDELFSCDECGQLFHTDDEIGTDYNSYCTSCYASLDDEEPNDEDDESVVPTTTYYGGCRICLTKRTHLHLLNELRLCRCEADVATSRREPVLLFEPA